MILRRYGTTFESVDLEFEAKALNEIGFRRNREWSIPADDFTERFDTVETVELRAEANGSVQNETEQVMLDRLRAKVEELVEKLPDGGVVVVDNDSGHDHPKPRQNTKNVIEQGENRLHFEYTIDPPLRVVVHHATD